MSPYDLAAKNGKTIYDTILPEDTLQVNGPTATTVNQTNVVAQPTATNAGPSSDIEDVVLIRLQQQETLIQLVNALGV